jgi:predicted nucleic acid-binding protein
MERQGMSVLDASVILKWFIDENDSDKAIRLREEYEANEREIVIPDFLLIEVANVLCYYPGFDSDDINDCLKTLFDMAIDIVTPTPGLLEHTIAIAKKYHITCYDALYLALAEDLGFPLITADQELYRKTLKIGIVQLL